MAFFYFQKKMFKVRTFCALLISTVLTFSFTGCTTNKVPIGIWSSFQVESHHSNIENITEEHVQLYGACCYSESVPHYLHRVIEADRGWVLMVGAGEGVTKSELNAIRVVNSWPPAFLNKLRLDHVSWSINDRMEVHRYLYDEPGSGILISLDFLFEKNEKNDRVIELIEQDLLSHLRVRGS